MSHSVRKSRLRRVIGFVLSAMVAQRHAKPSTLWHERLSLFSVGQALKDVTLLDGSMIGKVAAPPACGSRSGDSGGDSGGEEEPTEEEVQKMIDEAMRKGREGMKRYSVQEAIGGFDLVTESDETDPDAEPGKPPPPLREATDEFDIVLFYERERCLFFKIVNDNFQCPDAGQRTWPREMRKQWRARLERITRNTIVKDFSYALAMNGETPCAAAAYTDWVFNWEEAHKIDNIVTNTGDQCRGGRSALMCHLIRNSRDTKGNWRPLILMHQIVYGDDEPNLTDYYTSFGCFSPENVEENTELLCPEQNPAPCKGFVDKVSHADVYFKAELDKAQKEEEAAQKAKEEARAKRKQESEAQREARKNITREKWKEKRRHEIAEKRKMKAWYRENTGWMKTVMPAEEVKAREKKRKIDKFLKMNDWWLQNPEVTDYESYKMLMEQKHETAQERAAMNISSASSSSSSSSSSSDSDRPDLGHPGDPDNPVRQQGLLFGPHTWWH
eukprot:gnl/TRDRNA2_/TRDRNA2_82969_c0_seq1.p1 gnl/TRDRNA2_/TRDRNA2_82969_c0~~gnl/TRDRNA2_/TRDRNA2_82969_c0_seq1.p1  ORF type:complete len:499 (+),score=86.33 gnl/TRDRNA2_/TRDRNA2_82969_c0_seq1:70-1566(+)